MKDNFLYVDSAGKGHDKVIKLEKSNNRDYTKNDEGFWLEL